MSRKSPTVQAAKPDAMTPAALAIQLAKISEHNAPQNAKNQKSPVDDEFDKIAQDKEGDDSEALATADDGVATTAGSSGSESPIHLAEADKPASDAPPAAAGSVPAGSQAGAEAMSAGAGGATAGGISTGMMIAGGVIGVLAISNNSNDSNAAPATTVEGSVIGGPVINGNGLVVHLYQADGTTTIKDASNNPITATLNANGSFSVEIGSYTGVVIAKVEDTNANPDYIDEATGQPHGLTTTLMAMGVANGGTLTLNINPLTTVAVAVAGANPSAEEVTQTNDAVAQAFGLGNLTNTDIVTTVDATGNANAEFTPDSLSDGEKYGAVLAALSGMDSNLGGTQSTIDALAGSITVSGTNGTLNAAGINDLFAGAAAADNNTAGSLVNSISELLASSNSSISINTIAGDNAINATEMGAGVTISGTNVAGATVALSIGGASRDATSVTDTTWSYTLQGADYTAMGQGGETITATSTLTTGTGSSTSTTTATAMRSIVIDTVTPTLAITSDVTAVKGGETAVITFTFSEAPNGFAAADVTTTGGTLSAPVVTADPKVYTATFTPTAGTAAGSASITVAAGTYTDAAANTGGAGTTPSISIDTLAPTLAITSNVAAVKSGETATVTFTFSEAPSGFTAADVTTTGGSLSGLAVTADPKVYSATFTPSTDHEGNASITVAAGNYADAAGNAGGAVATPAISIDTLAPTLAITSNVAAVKIGETATITFTFSEAPSGFAPGDVVTTGGTLSDPAVTADPKVYTATFTPTPGTASGNASITVASGNYADAAGNAGGAGASPSVSIDTVAPTITVNPITGDNIIGVTEYTGAVVVSGATTGAEDGQTVTVHLNGQDYTASVASNAWTLTVPSAHIGVLTDHATYAVTADVFDQAGNPAVQASQNVLIAATGPVITINAISGDDFINATEHASAATIAGTVSGADGQTLTVHFNGQDYTSPVTAGAWSVTVDAGTVTALADATYAVTADVSDSTGNPAQQASRNLVVDTTIATPTVALTHDNGTSNSDGLSNDATLTTSTAASDVSRTFSVDGGAASAAYTAPTADGSHTVVVTDTDMAGNTANASVTFTLDKTLATPTLALTNDTGSSNSDKITSDAALTFSGTAGDVSRTFSVDGGAASASYTAPTADGSHTVVVTDTDTAGNTANASLTFTLDKSIDTPTVALTHDNGSSNSDGLTNDASLSTSAAAVDVTRTFTVDGGAASASYTAPTTDGDHTVVVTDTDTAGNTANASVSFTLDTTLATPTLSLTNDTGSSNSDKITSDASVAASSTAPDITRTFTVDGGAATGSYTPPTADGSHTVVVTDVDPAGNTRSASLTFTRDTTAPTLTISGVDISNDTGGSASDFYTSSAAQTINGTLSDTLSTGDMLQGSVDNGANWTDITGNVNGTTINWTGATLTAGSDTIAFRVTDAAGNVGATTGTQAYTVDTTAPSFSSDDSATFPNLGTGTAYTAVASDASAVSYSLSGTDAGLFDINAGTGAVTFKTAPDTASPVDAGGDNVYNFDVVATDLGGLATTHAVAISVVNAPSLTSTIDDVANFEVTSNIVLSSSEAVTAVADKYIHLINDGGTGFHGESNVNTQDILVTDTAMVSIVGNVITINPQFDLDFNNTYHIMVDDGAFLGVSSGQASVATADASAMNFSTVNPSATATAAASQAMNSGTDAMVAGHDWWDAEGNSSPAGTPVARDFADGNKAITANDLATIGIQTNDFYIAVNNFGAGDLIYFDNHGDNAVQRQSLIGPGLILDFGSAPTQIITGASNTATGQNGGQFDVTLEGMTNSFFTNQDIQTLLNVSYLPVLYG